MLYVLSLAEVTAIAIINMPNIELTCPITLDVLTDKNFKEAVLIIVDNTIYPILPRQEDDGIPGSTAENNLKKLKHCPFTKGENYQALTITDLNGNKALRDRLYTWLFLEVSEEAMAERSMKNLIQLITSKDNGFLPYLTTRPFTPNMQTQHAINTFETGSRNTYLLDTLNQISEPQAVNALHSNSAEFAQLNHPVLDRINYERAQYVIHSNQPPWFIHFLDRVHQLDSSLSWLLASAMSILGVSPHYAVLEQAHEQESYQPGGPGWIASTMRYFGIFPNSAQLPTGEHDSFTLPSPEQSNWQGVSWMPALND
ncbi:MAG: hypothetical protein CMF55_04565 [Legionellales bacterium]|nr:hypothetical protein [Legionellales bacterium]